jgi:NodT family efflux transporter outer membrane factor (OMF) lipoprotein
MPRCPAGLILSLAILGGCAQVPPLPEAAARIDVPEGWSAAQAAASDAPAVGLAWWRQFDDPKLTGLVETALVSAADIRTAQARLRQARASRDLAVAGLFPSIGLSATAKRSKAGDSSAQTLFSAGFDASWEPPIFGGQRDAAAAATADLLASNATLAATRVSLAAEVALDYVALRTYQQRLKIAQDNAASQAETLQITEWKSAAGLATSLDVEQARTNLEQSRATIPGLEVGRSEAEHSLALLTGQAPAALQEALASPTSLPAVPPRLAAAIPADTLRQRPDVRAAEYRLRAEAARSSEQRAARFPSLSLSGSLGWQAFSAGALGGSDTLLRAVTGSLAATLFDGGRRQALIDMQGAVEEQSLVAYQTSVLSALGEVENALATYAAGHERLASRRRAAEAARNATLLARTLYEAGTADFQKVLDTDRARLSAEDGLASAEGDLLAAVIKLYKALGGGWSADHAEDAPT